RTMGPGDGGRPLAHRRGGAAAGCNDRLCERLLSHGAGRVHFGPARVLLASEVGAVGWAGPIARPRREARTDPDGTSGAPPPSATKEAEPQKGISSSIFLSKGFPPPPAREAGFRSP